MRIGWAQAAALVAGLGLGAADVGGGGLAAATMEPLLGPVTRVRDGDTLELAGRVIRLQGLAAPELREPLGQEARRALAGLVEGRVLACWPDGTTTHGRIVAVCRLDGLDISAHLVRLGLARDCPRFSAGRYAALEAEAASRGASVQRIYPLPTYCRRR